jgi:hypothetical protein
VVLPSACSSIVKRKKQSPWASHFFIGRFHIWQLINSSRYIFFTSQIGSLHYRHLRIEGKSGLQLDWFGPFRELLLLVLLSRALVLGHSQLPAHFTSPGGKTWWSGSLGRLPPTATRALRPWWSLAVTRLPDAFAVCGRDPTGTPGPCHPTESTFSVVHTKTYLGWVWVGGDWEDWEDTQNEVSY